MYDKGITIVIQKGGKKMTVIKLNEQLVNIEWETLNTRGQIKLSWENFLKILDLFMYGECLDKIEIKGEKK